MYLKAIRHSKLSNLWLIIYDDDSWEYLQLDEMDYYYGIRNTVLREDYINGL